MRKGRKPFPMRSCLKNTAPFESHLIMNATSTITGENNIKPKSAKTISNVRLITKSSAAHLEQRHSTGTRTRSETSYRQIFAWFTKTNFQRRYIFMFAHLRPVQLHSSDYRFIWHDSVGGLP